MTLDGCVLCEETFIGQPAAIILIVLGLMVLWYLTAWRKIFTLTEQGELWLEAKFVQVVVSASLIIVKLLTVLRRKTGNTTETEVNSKIAREPRLGLRDLILGSLLYSYPCHMPRDCN